MLAQHETERTKLIATQRGLQKELDRARTTGTNSAMLEAKMDKIIDLLGATLAASGALDEDGKQRMEHERAVAAAGTQFREVAQEQADYIHAALDAAGLDMIALQDDPALAPVMERWTNSYNAGDVGKLKQATKDALRAIKPKASEAYKAESVADPAPAATSTPAAAQRPALVDTGESTAARPTGITVEQLKSQSTKQLAARWGDIKKAVYGL